MDDGKKMAPRDEKWSLRPSLRALAAVIFGNVIYFIILKPHLPNILRHRRFVMDAGLVIDFLLCLGIYVGFGKIFREK